MKLNLNTQNVLLGVLLLYFIYDIYKKYIQNNSESNLNTKNILENLIELFFSNKRNIKDNKNKKNKNNKLLIDNDNNIDNDNDKIINKKKDKKNKKDKKDKKKGKKKNLNNKYLINNEDTNILIQDDVSDTNESDDMSDTNESDDISDINESDNISDTNEDINEDINEDLDINDNNIDIVEQKENILNPIMLHNENINIITKELDKKILENSYIYFDINVGNEFLGKIIIKLYDHIVPTTCNNFRKLAISSPINDDNQPAYTGCIFHKVVKDFMIQSGDFENNDGSGGVSIYGEYFDDEITELTHNKPGLLTMANSGKNTNNSQFIILTKPASHLDGKHTIFGEVIYGMDTINTIENVPVDNEYTPLEQVYIAKSGLLLPTF